MKSMSITKCTLLQYRFSLQWFFNMVVATTSLLVTQDNITIMYKWKHKTFNMYIDMVGYFAEERVARMTSLILVDKYYYEYVIDIVLARGIYIVNTYWDEPGVQVLGL